MDNKDIIVSDVDTVQAFDFVFVAIFVFYFALVILHVNCHCSLVVPVVMNASMGCED